MATTIQHNPVLLQPQNNHTDDEDEDIALANFISSSLRFDQPQEIWNYPQQQPAAFLHKSQVSQQSRQQRARPRVSSNSSQTNSSNSTKLQPQQQFPQKSTSAPISNRNTPPRKIQPSTSSRSSTTHPKYASSSPPLISSSESSNTKSSSRRKSDHVQSFIPQDTAYYRRPSLTNSVSSGLSIQSEMSVNTKISLSKRLRRVFSMNNLKNSGSSSDLASLAERNGSNSSIASTSTAPIPKPTEKGSFRRRSIASLSSLFQKHATVPEVENIPQPSVSKANSSNSVNRRHSSGDLRQLAKEENKKRPELRVDTSESSQTKKGGLKVRSTVNSNSSTVPDSPNSAASTRSFSRLPPPSLQRNFVQEPGLPSPAPSTSSSKPNDDDKPIIGSHYGFGFHASPRLKPASSSTSSLAMPERKIQFCSTIQIHETFAANDYDRRCDNNSTCQRLTPIMAMKIKQELNEFKLTEMEVHVESRQFTHFFL